MNGGEDREVTATLSTTVGGSGQAETLREVRAVGIL